MVFSNPWFLLFWAAVLLLLAPGARHEDHAATWKKRALTAASCLFYAAWDVRYLGLLLSVSLTDYWCARRIAAAPGVAARRGYLWLSIASNLGLLGYFKYAGFFAHNLDALLGTHLSPLSILLPAGISFYTFKTMSYVIDVYRGEIRPRESWLDYAMFVTFFPELIAGPIVRASVFLPQLTRPIGPTRERLAVGLSLFLCGASKKVLADHLGIQVSPVFADPLAFHSSTAWAALLGYSLQIYLDFSGYSDMAVGCARTLGYELPENFRMPYLAENVSEFWRRWHITLSTWLRDYLYLPLGGNRRGPLRTYGNLLATMLLGGLWHGASWNFVLWGALHGGALALHRALKSAASGRALLPRGPAIAVTFLFCSLCWIPFRCPSFAGTAAMLQALWPARTAPSIPWVSYELPWIVALVVLGHAVGVTLEAPGPRARRLLQRLGACAQPEALSGVTLRLSLATAPGVFVVVLWLLCVLLFAVTQTTPFIYFQF